MLRNETWEECKVAKSDLKSIRESLETPLLEEEQFDREDRVEATVALLESVNIVRNPRPSSQPQKTPQKVSETDESGCLEDIERAGSSIFTPSSIAVLRWLSRCFLIGKDFPRVALQVAEAASDVLLLYTHTVVELVSNRRSVAPGEPIPLDHHLEGSEKMLLAQLRNR